MTWHDSLMKSRARKAEKLRREDARNGSRNQYYDDYNSQAATNNAMTAMLLSETFSSSSDTSSSCDSSSSSFDSSSSSCDSGSSF